MIKDITFGQYYPTDSFIHRLDPRFKSIVLLLLIVLLFVCKGFLSLGILTLFVFSILLLSKVPLKLYFKNIKAILPVIILTSILNLFYTKGGYEISLFWGISIWSQGITRAIFMALRIFTLIILSSVLTYTTTPNDITDAIERLLSPLRYVGLDTAVHTLSMMMTIALRFVPTLIDETDKIMNAQKARGADLESGSIVKRIKALLPILIPLLISSVRRAYELAEAMECRCYNGGKGRQRLKVMKLSTIDYFSMLTTFLLCGAVTFISLHFKV